MGQDAAPSVQEEGSEPVNDLELPSPPADAELPAVEPVISDEEFDSLVPAFDDELDPELDQPLESIEEFRQRIAGDEPQIAPLGNDGTADQGADPQALSETRFDDAVLDEPLPDLDSFQYEPRDYAAAEAQGASVAVKYRVKITGLDEADDQTDANMRGLFNSLSALRDGDGEAANLSQVYARLSTDQALLKTIFESEGWYEPAIDTRIVSARESGEDKATALLEATPGQRYSFGSVTVQADETVPPHLISKNLPLKEGQPIIAQRVQGAEARVALALPENGYPFAELGERSILLDRDTGTGDYTLPVTIGPRARFGGVTTTGDLAFDAEHVEVLARFERGDLYDSREVDDLRKALVATGLLGTVSVEPERTGEDTGAGDGTEYVTLHVDQQAGPPRTIAGQLGYATGEGFRVEGSWTHRNLFPPEGALILAGTAGTLEQSVSATFRRSNAGQRDKTFQLATELARTNFAALDSYTAKVSAQYSYDSTPIWQKRITYAYGVQARISAEEDYNYATGGRERRTFYIGGLTGKIGWDTSDDLLNPTRGFRLTALVEPEAGLEDGFYPYVRTQLDGSAYYPVTNALVLAGRVRLGTIQGASNLDIAPSRRFYAGGGGSVRGFGYQEVGPRAPDGDPVGGRSLFEAAAEARYRFGDYGLATFVDIGQAYRETTPQFTDIRMGAGVGFRYYTNFGPFRFDIATPIDRRDGESWISVYVSIGQAF